MKLVLFHTQENGRPERLPKGLSIIRANSNYHHAITVEIASFDREFSNSYKQYLQIIILNSFFKWQEILF